jgi:hypothetical protein
LLRYTHFVSGFSPPTCLSDVIQNLLILPRVP